MKYILLSLLIFFSACSNKNLEVKKESVIDMICISGTSNLSNLGESFTENRIIYNIKDNFFNKLKLQYDSNLIKEDFFEDKLNLLIKNESYIKNQYIKDNKMFLDLCIDKSKLDLIN